MQITTKTWQAQNRPKTAPMPVKIRAALMALVLSVFFTVPAGARDKLVWVGPVYEELVASLRFGFKHHYKKVHDKEVEITFLYPGGWPVCVDKVRTWGDRPEADIFLGAGAPAHEVMKQEGLLVPFMPRDADKIPAQWRGMKVKDKNGYWTCFAPWLITNLCNEQVLLRLNLPRPHTWRELLDPVYRGHVVFTLPYASGTMHETVEIILQTFGQKEGWAYLRRLAAQVDRFSRGSTDTTRITSTGQAAIGVAQPQMNALMARQKGYPVSNLLPEKTILVPEAAALLKNAPHPAVAKIFLNWLFSMEGQRYVLEGGYFPARADIRFSAWEKQGAAMAGHALRALGKNSFWDINVRFIQYDLDLAAKRWDDVNRFFEYEIHRKWPKLKAVLSLIEGVEKSIDKSRAANRDVTRSEMEIREARDLLLYDGDVKAARAAALKVWSRLKQP